MRASTSMSLSCDPDLGSETERRFSPISPLFTPTVSPLLTSITSRNVLFLQSLPHSIPYRQANVRRRKDDTCVGTATRSIVKRLSRVPCHLPSDARSSRCVRRALPAGACVRGCPPPRAPLPPRAPVPIATQEC